MVMLEMVDPEVSDLESLGSGKDVSSSVVSESQYPGSYFDRTPMGITVPFVRL